MYTALYHIFFYISIQPRVTIDFDGAVIHMYTQGTRILHKYKSTSDFLLLSYFPPKATLYFSKNPTNLHISSHVRHLGWKPHTAGAQWSVEAQGRLAPTRAPQHPPPPALRGLVCLLPPETVLLHARIFFCQPPWWLGITKWTALEGRGPLFQLAVSGAQPSAP